MSCALVIHTSLYLVPTQSQTLWSVPSGLSLVAMTVPTLQKLPVLCFSEGDRG